MHFDPYHDKISFECKIFNQDFPERLLLTYKPEEVTESAEVAEPSIEEPKAMSSDIEVASPIPVADPIPRAETDDLLVGLVQKI